MLFDVLSDIRECGNTYTGNLSLTRCIKEEIHSEVDVLQWVVEKVKNWTTAVRRFITLQRKNLVLHTRRHVISLEVLPISYPSL